AAEGQSAFNGWINLEAMLFGQISTHVALGKLIDVHRHELQVRPSAAVIIEAFQNLADDDIGMRVHSILRSNSSDFFLGHSATEFLFVSGSGSSLIQSFRFPSRSCGRPKRRRLQWHR